MSLKNFPRAVIGILTFCFLFSCSSDSEDVPQSQLPDEPMESENEPPIISKQVFKVEKNTARGAIMGTVKAAIFLTSPLLLFQ